METLLSTRLKQKSRSIEHSDNRIFQPASKLQVLARSFSKASIWRYIKPGCAPGSRDGHTHPKTREQRSAHIALLNWKYPLFAIHRL